MSKHLAAHRHSSSAGEADLASTVDALLSLGTAPQVGRLDCTACAGTGGHSDDSTCTVCHGSGSPRCRDCASVATIADAHTAEHGPACEDCAARCTHCGDAWSTQLVLVRDDQDDGERSERLCDDCAEDERARAKRIRAHAAAEHSKELAYQLGQEA